MAIVNIPLKPSQNQDPVQMPLLHTQPITTVTLDIPSKPQVTVLWDTGATKSYIKDLLSTNLSNRRQTTRILLNFECSMVVSLQAGLIRIHQRWSTTTRQISSY